MRNQIFVWILAALTAAVMFIIVGSTAASAFPAGSAGYSGNPDIGGRCATCSQCHNGGAEPSVSISGPATVEPGETNTYTLTISGGQEAFGGLAVSVTDGALAAGSGSQLASGEVTQTEAKAAAGDGTVSWTFDWTAPGSAGTASMYGAGNSTDGIGASGDATGTDVLAITIEAAAQPTPTPEPVDDDDDDAGGVDGAALYADNCSGCHGSLASSAKAGRSAAQISGAITSIDPMGSLSSLSDAQIDAIADALAGDDAADDAADDDDSAADDAADDDEPLPRTGSDVGFPVFVGLGLLGVGGISLVTSRRRRL